MTVAFGDLSVVDLLHRASQCAEETFKREIGDVDLTARQFAILQAVARNEGLSQASIVEATGIDRSTIAEMMIRLVARGWLKRRRTRNDARAYAVRLTAEGRRIVRSVEPAWRAADERIHGAVRAVGRNQFRRALLELIEAAEARRAPALGSKRPR
jgi:DNA-binding MarR family transcriptional regulator